MSSSFQAADALPVGPAPFVRRRFTVDEFQRMAETGIFTPDDHDLVHELVEIRTRPTGDTYADAKTLRRGDCLTSSIPALTGLEVDDVLGERGSVTPAA